MGVSQNYGYPLGVPIVRTIVFWGLYWGPLVLGNYLVEISVFEISPQIDSVNLSIQGLPNVWRANLSPLDPPGLADSITSGFHAAMVACKSCKISSCNSSVPRRQQKDWSNYLLHHAVLN